MFCSFFNGNQLFGEGGFVWREELSVDDTDETRSEWVDNWQPGALVGYPDVSHRSVWHFSRSGDAGRSLTFDLDSGAEVRPGFISGFSEFFSNWI